MATLYVSEHQDVAGGPGRMVLFPLVAEPAEAEQTVEIGIGSVSSDPFGPSTFMVRVHADTACHIKFGENPEATISNKKLIAGQTEYFGVRPGDRIAVIEAV